MTALQLTFAWVAIVSFAAGWLCARVKTALESPYLERRKEQPE